MGWTLVTGGARRVGKSICLKLSEEGHDVAIHYRASEQEAKAVAAECQEKGVRAEIVQGNFTTAEGVEEFLVRYQKGFEDTVGIVNNVGNYLRQPATATPHEEWEALYQTNFFAPLRLSLGLLPSLKRGGGSIVNLGCAGLSTDRASKVAVAYMSTKMALLHLTLSLAKEVAVDGVRVNMVSPGHLTNSVDLPSDVSTLPMGRAGDPEEVAELVAFLLSSRSVYITGQNIEVAGAHYL